MDPKSKLNKLLTGTLGLMGYVVERTRTEVGKVVEAAGGNPDEKPSGENPSGMQRVTDAAGEEYLCPVSVLGDKDFVREHEKSNCFEYNTVARHFVE